MYAQLALAAYQLISSSQQAEQVDRQARTQKMIDDMNADFMEIDAYNADIAGFTKSAAYQVTADQTISQQRSVQAAQNVDVNFGTAKDIQDESKLNAKLNQVDIINKAHETSMGLKSQARNLRLHGTQAVSQGEASSNAVRTSGYAAAASSVITAHESDPKKFKNTFGY